MSSNRRDFLKRTSAAGGAVALGLFLPDAHGAPGPKQSSRRGMRILILGGTSFIGPPQVRYALERGHTVTLFNRGRTNPGLFPNVEQLRGDRNGDLESLKGRTWDVVIDNSASNPKWVELSAQLLKNSARHYMYVSSISAYASMSRVPMTIEAPVFTYETAGVSPGAEKLPYGLAKALSEQEAEKAFPGRTTIIRPGLIVGPGDDTDRFTYWPVRINRGGEVLAPGDQSDPTQIIDARDLSEWMIRLAEGQVTGVYNGLGPATPRPMAEMLYGIRAVTTAETTFTWVPADFLETQKIKPWVDAPVWVPPLGDEAGSSRFDLTREVNTGLTFRPLAVTARDTLEFHFSRPPERQARLRFGMTAEREAEVLAAWHARKG
jgi:2'-hydroxyisoflavone reductase